MAIKKSAKTPVSRADSGKVEVKDSVGKGFYIGNRSTCPRGFMLKRGLVILDPYEIREVPAQDADEVRELLKAPGMQAMVDSGLLQISDKAIYSLTAHPTPTPPLELKPEAQVASTGATVKASSSKDGYSTSTMRLDSKASI